MNEPDAKLFDSNVIKLSPTIAFAGKCTELRLAIIDQLDHMLVNERVVIWDSHTIIQYQDSQMVRNFQELKCANNQLEHIVTELMERHFYSNKETFFKLTHTLCGEIKHIRSYGSSDMILAEKMLKFDEVFGTYQNLCVKEFINICQNDSLLRKMEHICIETTSNLKRLIYVVRKQYEDKILLEFKSVLTEIELSDSMKQFQLTMDKRMDIYWTLNCSEIAKAFEEIWKESFGVEDDQDEYREREENFSNLYSIFKMEYKSMENKAIISKWFRNHD